ncbi:MAG: hypothetical protein H0X29_08970 [Parachlamydiaceae bacterium]|nr:hypothetical protein [Parachlamydiaceae bacterium]
MFHKIRLNRLEKMGADGRLWALIGIGKPVDAQHQRMLEIQARHSFYASGGNREAYIAFLPFDSFPDGLYCYVKKSEFVKAIANKTKNPTERLMGLPGDGISTLEKQRGVCYLNRSSTCSYLWKSS